MADEQIMKGGRMYRNQSVKPVAIICLTVLTIFILSAGGIYWLATEPERIERAAYSSLDVFIVLLSIGQGPFNSDESADSYLGRDPEEMIGGGFARRYYGVVKQTKDIKPHDSRAFPYKATLEFTTRAFSTVVHESSSEAKKDTIFYRSGLGFSNSSEDYRDGDTVEVIIKMSLLYDKAGGNWKVIDEDYQERKVKASK